jgi:uncharacterized protein (TIGR02246 family)
MVAITDSAGAKVKVVLDGWEAAWNASDMTAMWRLATDDVHWVNVVGMHWRGKAEVQKASAATLACTTSCGEAFAAVATGFASRCNS